MKSTKSRALTLFLFLLLGCLVVSAILGACLRQAPTAPPSAEEMSDPEFWISELTQAEKVLMSPGEISEWNTLTADAIDRVVQFEKYQETMTKDELVAKINTVSKVPTRTRYGADGNPISAGSGYYDPFVRNMDVDAIPDEFPVRFGITVRRTNLRIIPHENPLYSSRTSLDDQLQWTAVYALEPCAILHTSADGQWYFAHIYTCFAWMPVEDVALFENREAMLEYAKRDPFLMVTADRVLTQPDAANPEISELQLDMGVRVPLCATNETGPSADEKKVDSKNTDADFVVLLPIRNEDGFAELKQGLIARDEDVSLGYLPYTQENVIRQAFKMLGQRYGWGGTFNARDCSAFLMDIFKTMGLNPPRNSTEQAKFAVGEAMMNESMTLEELEAVLDDTEAGTGIFKSGHVMLYLGKRAGEHYMIHDSGYAGGVAVTPCSIYSDYWGVNKWVLPDDRP